MGHDDGDVGSLAGAVIPTVRTLKSEGLQLGQEHKHVSHFTQDVGRDVTRPVAINHKSRHRRVSRPAYREPLAVDRESGESRGRIERVQPILLLPPRTIPNRQRLKQGGSLSPTDQRNDRVRTGMTSSNPDVDLDRPESRDACAEQREDGSGVVDGDVGWEVDVDIQRPVFGTHEERPCAIPVQKMVFAIQHQARPENGHRLRHPIPRAVDR